MNIKYILVKLEKALAFQVLYMDERFRNGNSVSEPIFVHERKGFEKPYRVEVRSVAVPAIDYTTPSGCTVYLRGSTKADDKRVSIKTFHNNDERDRTYTGVMAALCDWSHNYKRFITEPKVLDDKQLTSAQIFVE